MKKKKVKVEQEGLISSIIGKVTRPIKDAIYTLQVKIHQLLHKNKPKKAMSGQRKRVGETIFYWAVLAFPLFQFSVMYIYVNFNSILMAFRTYIVNRDGTSTIEWAQPFYANFAEFFNALSNDGGMMVSRFTNSLIVYASRICFGTVFSILFSYYIYKQYVGSGAFRVILMLPSVISSIVFVMIFTYIADRVLPELGEKIGVEIPKLLTQGGYKLLFTIILFNIFVGFGSGVLMYSNAMSRIPDSLVEYAQLEGCTPFKEFWHITLPLAYPTIETFLVVGVANIFIDQANLYTFYMDNETACAEIQTVGYYLYLMIQKNSATRSQYTYASAIGLTLTAVTIPLVLGARYLLDKLDKGAEF